MGFSPQFTLFIYSLLLATDESAENEVDLDVPVRNDDLQTESKYSISEYAWISHQVLFSAFTI